MRISKMSKAELEKRGYNLCRECQKLKPWTEIIYWGMGDGPVCQDCWVGKVRNE